MGKVYLILVIANIPFAFMNGANILSGDFSINTFVTFCINLFAIGWCSAFLILHIMDKKINQRN